MGGGSWWAGHCGRPDGRTVRGVLRCMFYLAVVSLHSTFTLAGSDVIYRIKYHI